MDPELTAFLFCALVVFLSAVALHGGDGPPSA